MNGFAPGDLVTPIRIKNPHLHSFRMGGVYRVADVVKHPFHDQIGLVIKGHPSPHLMMAWCASFFRKIDKSDEGFAAWMRSMRPVKQPARAALTPSQENHNDQ